MRKVLGVRIDEKEADAWKLTAKKAGFDSVSTWIKFEIRRVIDEQNAADARKEK